jgi:putative glutamine amidotransferase
MTRRPVIGLTAHTRDAVGAEVSAGWALGRRYVDVLVHAGAVPWLVPLLHDDLNTLRAIYDRLDGVFMAGGADIDPVHYGEDRHLACGRADGPRDCAELALARWALEDGKPLLGLCRGIQVINVASGGTLVQDLATQRPDGIKHDYFPEDGRYPRDLIVHDVRLMAGSRLSTILGQETLPVNSRHHQGIKVLGEGLVACAFAPDGLIEGVVSATDQFAIGVQWHPEDLTDIHPESRRLFAAFIQASAANGADTPADRER